MEPSMHAGDYVIATSLLKKKFFFKNRLIIFFDQTFSYVIKRIYQISKYHLMLKSDNAKSSSFFCDKPIEKKQVLYVVLAIIKAKNILKFFKIK